MALDNIPRIGERMGRRRPAFFLDLDGTLAPLVSRPDLAKVPLETIELLTTLAHEDLVCIISGRDLADLRRMAVIDEAFYAADHGHRVTGPPGSDIDLEVGPADDLMLRLAAIELKRRLHSIDGVLVEAKGHSLSVHYRMVAEEQWPLVAEAMREVAESAEGLRLTGGKMVHELRPAIPWGKGRAMLWLLKELQLGRNDTCPVCIGDDMTDEDMFSAARGWGVTVIVGRSKWDTKADYMLPDCESTATFLRTFVPLGSSTSLSEG
jgi:trehalose 6-phosphate phosphatase